jgi:Holliday junction resolvase RusA-like endonuclease
MISIDLYGDPVAQKRPRVVRRGNFVNTYDPDSKLKEGYKWQVKSQFREEPLTGPVVMDIIFYMPIPKSESGIKKRQMANGIIQHMKKPDVDNLCKLYIDVINNLVLKDDSQIVELRAKKIYSNSPGTNIRIVPLSSEARDTLYESDTRKAR